MLPLQIAAIKVELSSLSKDLAALSKTINDPVNGLAATKSELAANGNQTKYAVSMGGGMIFLHLHTLGSLRRIPCMHALVLVCSQSLQLASGFLRARNEQERSKDAHKRV